VVFIAAGIGITPLVPMALKAKQLGIDYALHYSGGSRKDMAFVDSLMAVHGNRLALHISDEGSRANFQRIWGDFSRDIQVYACGPQRLLAELETLRVGLPHVILKVEHFQSSANSLDPLQEHGFEIELKDSGLVVQVPPDRTVMEALRSVNIDVQSDCGEGLCGSCEVRVLSGKVDHRDKVLTATERQSHSKMMVCCSRAQGNRLILEL
jgi:ferredoxin-NADP reductase